MQYHRQENDEAGNGEKAFGFRRPREHGEQDEQQRAKSARTEPRDEPSARITDAGVLQDRQQHHGAQQQTLGIQRPNLYRKARQLGIPFARIPE